MPQKYTRKTDRASWSQEDMQNAVDACRKGKMGIRKASKAFNIPRSTIANKVKLPADSDMSVHLGRRPCLGKEQEAKLAELIVEMQGQNSGLAKKDVRSLAFQFAEQNGLAHDFDQDKKTAGRFWLEGFLKRHPNISLKKATSLTKAHASGMTKEVVANYFKQLGKFLDQEGMHQTPEKLYNVDETRFSMINSQGKGVAEKDENVAVVLCCSATGHYIPPYVIMKGKCMQEEYKDGLPPGSKLVVSETTSNNSDLFLDWLMYFRRHCVQGKVLLLDGHESHIKSTAILRYCIANEIILVPLPGRTTKYLQPIDQSVHRSLKMNFQKVTSLFKRTNPEANITKYRFSSLFAQAWAKTATLDNAISGFRVRGVYPFNPDAVPEEAYLLAEMTERTNSDQQLEQEPMDSESDYIYVYSDAPPFETDTTLPDADIASTSRGISSQDLQPLPKVDRQHKSKRQKRK